MSARSFSIVINTVDRAESLRTTLESLELLDHPDFEVVVVNGPSIDRTDELLEHWAGRIKLGRCENRNLSESRNIGISMSAGDIVAFIDDDAYPDPAWLDRLDEAYEDWEVAGAGGPVYAHNGIDIQAWYTRQDRLGSPWTSMEPDPYHNPTSALAFPKSRQFVCTIGTNSSFRRERLHEIGGFDEEFEYYMDETDVCARLVDSGFVLSALDDGFVYHKYLANDIREDDRTVRDFYQVLKSAFYLIHKHGTGTYSRTEVARAISDTTALWRKYLNDHIASGVLSEDSRAKFEQDALAASEAAMTAFARDTPRTRSREWFTSRTIPFLRFTTRRRAENKLHICLFSQEYPPDPVNGIGRVVHELATGLARAGHLVRVLTKAHHCDTVDLESGVWVHRMVPKPHPPPPAPPVPGHLWDYSSTLLDELVRVHSHRPVDVVQVPNWDSEGVAVVLDGRFNWVLGLYTPLESVAGADENVAMALASGDRCLQAMVDTERFVYEHASNVLACGPAIVQEVEERYGASFPADRLGLVAHGLSDESRWVSRRPHPERLEVLFAGRLEARKGIDTFLDCIPLLSQEFPEAHFNIVGDDSLQGSSGRTFRQGFEGTHPELLHRVQFKGRVGDRELHQSYADCDVFVAPSRFESFGLVLIEAMMFSKPVVATNIGGFREIVQEGENGYLAPPGDPKSLAAAIAVLLGSEDLRSRFGSRSRDLYLEHFTAGTMVQGVNRYYDALTGRRTAGRDPVYKDDVTSML